MKRRELVVLLGGAVVWPLAAGAQQATMPVIGFLHPRSRADAITAISAFGRGLQDTGYVEGRNLATE